MALRQRLLVLYLASSSLDGPVVSWSYWDGTGAVDTTPGDEDEPPYRTGLHALRDGWRLLQMSPLLPHAAGDEFTTAYQRYEFLFEQLVDTVEPDTKERA